MKLLDRGWRRAGCFLYKPEMESTCCPAYTIRLMVDKFTPSKEQQRVFKRMQRYVDGIWDGKKQEFPDKSEDSQGFAHGDEFSSSSKVGFSGTKEHKSRDDELLICLSEELNLVIQSLVKSGDLPCDLQYPPGSVKFVSPAKKRQIVEGSEDLMFTSNISFQIAAILRKARADDCDAHLTGFSSFGNGTLSDLSPKTIAEKLASALQHLVNSLNFSVKACNGHINYYSSVKETLSDKLNYRVSPSSEFSTQHDSKVRTVIPENPRRNKRKLEIHLKRSSFDPEEFALYKKYQTKVHNDNPDDVRESSYKRFLVDTPLVYIPPTNDNCTVPSCGFGSFHQQYRIDGRLIAVGVIDILPKCLSSKYLFWDPDLAFLSLGKYAALQEINWVIENQRDSSSLQYYYLGYYIHSCPKMSYKAAYHPSELLCPLRYEWVPYIFVKSVLDQTRYAVLSDYANIQSRPLSLTQKQNEFGDEDFTNTCLGQDDTMIDPESGSSNAELRPVEKADLGDILLDKNGTRIRYKKLQRRLRPAVQARLGNQLLTYKEMVGRQLSERMIYSLI
ncbi:arginyl-tRNA--protein transferase 2-like isoform X2 [Silene latifolia]|uniref:arginyl-tRNA--protein transferase 2-like isoform X2 n=1 Tax=Silene latifolia TaxID=37657 RepID=UPI003D77902B